jgi:hypothetical protein
VTLFGVGPRIGYDAPISNLVSIWPKIGFTFAHSHAADAGFNGVGVASGAGLVSVSNDQTLWLFDAYVPVLLHPAPHFFLGFGPYIDTQLNGDVRSTAYGGKFTLGGWF